jgi:hypothetical protein
MHLRMVIAATAVTAAVAAMAAAAPASAAPASAAPASAAPASAAPAPAAAAPATGVTAPAGHGGGAPALRPRPARLATPAPARVRSAHAATCAAAFAGRKVAPVRHATSLICLKHGLTASAGPRQAQFQPLPSWCGDYPAGSWWYYRTDACLLRPWTVGIYRLNDDGSMTQIGWFSFWELSYSYTSYSISTWGQQMQISGTGAGGDVSGLTIQGSASCSGSCSLDSVDFAPQSALSGMPGGTAFFDSTSTDPGAVGTATTTMSWWFTKPGVVPTQTVTSNPPQVRCDNNTPGLGPGCVFPGYMPVMTYSLSGPYPQLAQHISDAQSSGLPGAYPSGQPLSRLTDDTLQSLNRGTACPDSYPRPDSFSCDEYPFASTWQGAWTGGGDPRTFDWCQVSPPQPWSTGSSGYSVCMIDAYQNSAGGGALGAFYNSNRVMDGDQFQVWIQP